MGQRQRQRQRTLGSDMQPVLCGKGTTGRGSLLGMPRNMSAASGENHAVPWSLPLKFEHFEQMPDAKSFLQESPPHGVSAAAPS